MQQNWKELTLEIHISQLKRAPVPGWSMKRPADLKLTLKQDSDNKKTPGQDDNDTGNRRLSQDAGPDLYDCSCFLLGFFDSYM